MADQKITDLPEVTAVASNDWFEIVDSSTGLSGKVTQSTLLATLGAWQMWSPTATGWASVSASSYHYAAVGKLLFAKVYASGVSNSAVTKLTLPAGKTTPGFGVPQIGYCRVTDNGSVKAVPGMWLASDNASEIQFYLDSAETGFTASGAKVVNAIIVLLTN